MQFRLSVPSSSNMVLFLCLIWILNELIDPLAFGSYWVQILLLLKLSLVSLLLRSLNRKVIYNV
jgi:hypothetical protein